MSILEGLGAGASNFTVPLRLATAAGSIGVAAGAADSAGVLLDCSVFSFLLQAAKVSSAQRASMPSVVVQFVFLFMMCLSVGSSTGVLPAVARASSPARE